MTQCVCGGPFCGLSIQLATLVFQEVMPKGMAASFALVLQGWVCWFFSSESKFGPCRRLDSRRK